MKILHVITDLRLGGAERALAALALAQREAGHRVTVLALKQLGPAAEPLQRAGIPCAALDAPDAPGLGTAAAALAVGARMKTDPPDVVHAWLASACAAVKLAAPRGIPRVYACRVTTTPGPLVCQLLGAQDDGPRAWVAVSDAVADAWSTALHLPRAHFHVVPNGVEVPTRRAAEPPGARPCFLGRLARQKGVDLLLAALAGCDLELDLYGDGPEAAALTDMARMLGVGNRARFHGVAPDARAVLRAASLLVLPTRAEGMSNAVLEAMAEGRPVIAADVPGMREVVADGVTGILVPPGNARALAEALVSLQDNPARRRKLGAAGQARVRAQFTPAASHAEWTAVYDAVLRG
ncbi:MAG: glycosyltransferase family 4 protein [Deltaproteobacteria bacterium]|nr:glycosyltransferase family 4 protein [Deltaproteobacteria bacterium]